MQPAQFEFKKPTPEILQALNWLKDNLANREGFHIDLLEINGTIDSLYEPTDELKSCIDLYNQKYSKDFKGKQKKGTHKAAGRIMEQIAHKAFKSLAEAKTFKQITTPESQLDLIVTLAPKSTTASILKLAGDKIIIEAKNRSTKVDVKDFSRVVALLEYKYHQQSSLGVFFARKGATGFPTSNIKKIRVLQDCRAIQVVYNARSRKYIVVFDHDDIQNLLVPGALIRMLLSKMSAVADAPGNKITYDGKINEEDDLPPDF